MDGAVATLIREISFLEGRWRGNAERGPWMVRTADDSFAPSSFTLRTVVQLVQAKKSRPSQIGQISCEQPRM